jgi:integrase/recombinase XerD
MAITIAKVFRRDKVNEQGKGPVYIRITKNRKTSYICTDLRLEERHWDDNQKKVKPSHPNSSEANSYLNKFLCDIEAEVLQEQTSNRQASVRSIKEKFTEDKTTGFFVVAQGLLDKYKRNKKISTHDTCKATMSKVAQFAGTDKLSLQDIDLSFLNRFEAYLRDDLGNRVNTVHKDMRILRRVFNAAYKQGLIEHNQSPFHKYTMKAEKVFREHLVESELRQLEQLDHFPGPKLELHRDMFLFACYSGGIRVSDVLLLRWSCFDGTHIHLADRKTSSQHSVKLPNISLAIINKYKPDGANASGGFIFPMLPVDLDMTDFVEVDRRISSSTAYINKNLKALAKLAGIKKHLHFHMSRHSFACLALTKGMGIEYVSRLMNHSNIKQTQHYAKLVSKELDAAMEKFNK